MRTGYAVSMTEDDSWCRLRLCPEITAKECTIRCPKEKWTLEQARRLIGMFRHTPGERRFRQYPMRTREFFDEVMRYHCQTTGHCESEKTRAGGETHSPPTTS